MYGKFFASTFTGSMFGAGPDVFALWGYIIATAVEGVVEINPSFVAAVLGATPERISAALSVLCNPDSASRSAAEDGRRLVHEGAYQYRVVNHAHYRAIRNEEDRRAYNRDAKRRERERKATDVKPDVNDSQACQPIQKQSTEAETEAKEHVPAADAAVPSRFEEFWAAYPKKRDKGHAEKAFKALRVSDGLLSLMLSALEHQCRMTDWTKDRGKFIPLAATWLHGHRWDDEIGMGTDPERDRKLGPSYTPGDWWLSCRHEPKCETGPMHRQREQIDAMKGQP